MSAIATGAALLALAASPLRVVVHPGETTTITVRNLGAAAASVAAAPNAYRLDLRGRPQLAAASRSWLIVGKRRFALAPRRGTEVAVRVVAPRGARPGDHAQVLLFSAAALGVRGVRVAVRVGVVVVVRCPGILRRRLAPLALSARRTARGPVLRLLLRNAGNVDEWVSSRRLVVQVWRGSRQLALLRPRPRRLLAGARGLFEWSLGRRITGPISIVVSTGAKPERRYRLRL